MIDKIAAFVERITSFASALEGLGPAGRFMFLALALFAVLVALFFLKTLVTWVQRLVLLALVGCLAAAACVAATRTTAPEAQVAAGRSAQLSALSPGPASPAASPQPAARSPQPPVSGAPLSVPFEVVAEGDAPANGRREALTLAVRGQDVRGLLPEALPDVAHDALLGALAGPDSALYVVIYAGAQPSSGYRVRIDAVTRQVEGEQEKLVVTYHVEAPTQGAAAVETHPYVVAQVMATDMQPGDVVFEER
jgi:hypothetical protein